VLLTACDDAFFATAAAARLDPEALRALARRRAPALEAVARGAPPEQAGQGDAWVVRLCAAIAPIAPPRWMPMADLIEEGLSLEHGARGVRSWFTSRPSDKDAARVRTQGAFAVRALTAVLGADGELTPDARLQRSCLAASLGLPEDEQRVLVAEPPAAVDGLALPEGLTPKLVRALLRGAFVAALFEGSGPREEQGVLALGHRTGLPGEETTAAHGEARRAVEGLQAFGASSVEAIRFVLQDDRPTGEPPAAAAARLLLPAPARRDALAALASDAPLAPGRRYALDRKQREAVLGLAWAAALRSDPTVVRRVDLATRHDQVAADLGDPAAGREARQIVEAFLEEALAAVAPLVPPPLAPA